MTTAYVLWVLFWGADGRATMSSHEYTSRDRCETAKAAIAATMDSKVSFYGSITYSVCTQK